MIDKKGKLRRFINGREVTRWSGMLHRQFNCAERMFYNEVPGVTMEVKAVGIDVEYHIINKRLDAKWLGKE